MPDPAAHWQGHQLAHCQDDKRHRGCGRNPHPTREVGQFLAWLVRRHHRLQRHAADRAGPRLIADDFGMHRTGVLDVGRGGLLLSGGTARGIEPRISFELLLAFFRAEMEGLAVELRVTPVRLDGDRHPANWVLCRLGPRRDVGGRVIMFVVHVQPAFRSVVSVYGF